MLLKTLEACEAHLWLFIATTAACTDYRVSRHLKGKSAQIFIVVGQVEIIFIIVAGVR